jgi:hypothetical protein
MLIFSLFLLTNAALVRAGMNRGFSPGKRVFYPLLVQVENCPGRTSTCTCKMNIEQYRIIIEVIESLSGRDRIIISQSIETPRRG